MAGTVNNSRLISSASDFMLRSSIVPDNCSVSAGDNTSGWLMTGFSASVRAEVKEARKRAASVLPIPPPNVGVALRVVQFE